MMNPLAMMEVNNLRVSNLREGNIILYVIKSNYHGISCFLMMMTSLYLCTVRLPLGYLINFNKVSILLSCI